MKHLSTLLKTNPNCTTSPPPLFISLSPQNHLHHHLRSVAKTIELSVRQLQTLTTENGNRRNPFPCDFSDSFFPTFFLCQESAQRPWAPPGRDLQWISPHKTGEKYFLQTQTVCRMIQADKEGVGWCAWARETLQTAGVKLFYSRLHREVGWNTSSHDAQGGNKKISDLWVERARKQRLWEIQTKVFFYWVSEKLLVNENRASRHKPNGSLHLVDESLGGGWTESS